MTTVGMATGTCSRGSTGSMTHSGAQHDNKPLCFSSGKYSSSCSRSAGGHDNALSTASEPADPSTSRGRSSDGDGLALCPRDTHDRKLNRGSVEPRDVSDVFRGFDDVILEACGLGDADWLLRAAVARRAVTLGEDDASDASFLTTSGPSWLSRPRLSSVSALELGFNGGSAMCTGGSVEIMRSSGKRLVSLSGGSGVTGYKHHQRQ